MKPTFLRLASAAVSLWTTPRGSLRAQERPKPLPKFDRRLVTLAPARLEGDREAALETLKARIPGVVLDLHPITVSPIWIHNRLGFLSRPPGERLTAGSGSWATNEVERSDGPVEAESDDPHVPIKSFLAQNAVLFGHGAEVLADARMTRDYVTVHNGLRTVVWQQELDGIPILEALWSAHVTKRGELVTLSSGFVPSLAKAADAGAPDRRELQTNPPISARCAVVEAAMHVGETLTAEEVVPVGSAPMKRA